MARGRRGVAAGCDAFVAYSDAPRRFGNDEFSDLHKMNKIDSIEIVQQIYYVLCYGDNVWTF